MKFNNSDAHGNFFLVERPAVSTKIIANDVASYANYMDEDELDLTLERYYKYLIERNGARLSALQPVLMHKLLVKNTASNCMFHAKNNIAWM